MLIDNLSKRKAKEHINGYHFMVVIFHFALFVLPFM